MNEETSWAKWMHNVGMLKWMGTKLTLCKFDPLGVSQRRWQWPCFLRLWRSWALSVSPKSQVHLFTPQGREGQKVTKSAFSGLPGGNGQARAAKPLALHLLRCTVWEWGLPGSLPSQRRRLKKWGFVVGNGKGTLFCDRYVKSLRLPIEQWPF